MIKIADSIISPLGFGTEANYQAVKAGKSALRRYEGLWGLPEPFVASLFDREVVRESFAKVPSLCACTETNYTFFEQILILSVYDALSQCDINPASDRVQFILSTTKGNVYLLDKKQNGFERDRVLLGVAARKVAQFFGNSNQPVVVSNACISGVCAQIEALRTLQAGECDYAVVMGADMQSPFIISGFQSFKALSPEPCRPFDANRKGLNLGEAAACVVYGSVQSTRTQAHWQVLNGVIRNDANHISGPSRTGEGSYRALVDTLGDFDPNQLAVINVHGTATLYNDEMESFAITRAGLKDVPVNGLKGYYGHTMGAAGIMESILTMRSLEDHTILATRGFETMGVSNPLSISNQHRTTDKKSFVKLLSGFGGCNAALLFAEDSPSEGCLHLSAKERFQAPSCSVKSSIRLTPEFVELNGTRIQTASKGRELLSELYRNHINDYPKFFKMDALCKLGFVASELLLKGLDEPENDQERVVVFCNQSASLNADTSFQQTIQDLEQFYPSPSVFVYTLPNIVTGEIAIRNKFFGETNFLVLAEKDEYTMNRCIQHAFQDPSCKSVIAGWLNCNSEDDFEAEMRIIKQKTYNMEELILKLKQEIIEVLNLEDMKPEDIDENASLFGEGLGLDSIDALELIVLMEKNYGIKLQDPAQGKEIFKSVAVMADYITKNRTK